MVSNDVLYFERFHKRITHQVESGGLKMRKVENLDISKGTEKT